MKIDTNRIFFNKKIIYSAHHNVFGVYPRLNCGNFYPLRLRCTRPTRLRLWRDGFFYRVSLNLNNSYSNLTLCF